MFLGLKWEIVLAGTWVMIGYSRYIRERELVRLAFALSMGWKRGRSKDELLVPGLSQCRSVNCASTAGDVGSIPGQGTKIPHAMSFRQKKKKPVKCGSWAKSSLAPVFARFMS